MTIWALSISNLEAIILLHFYSLVIHSLPKLLQHILDTFQEKKS